MPSQHENFMWAALEEAYKALAQGEFPAGAIIVAGDRVVAKANRAQRGGKGANELDHAEMRALAILAESARKFAPETLTIYSTLEPCLMCYSATLLAGIRRLVWAYEDIMAGATGLELQRLKPLYQGMAPHVLGGVLRKESLALFQQFFHRNNAWKGSLLARYTLAQQTEEAQGA